MMFLSQHHLIEKLALIKKPTPERPPLWGDLSAALEAMQRGKEASPAPRAAPPHARDDPCGPPPEA